eukprot:TRINITY_DN16572_c0_g1_i1.p1 TRINITY_DN16572_c0_g1~~TRINITY_DN16572_c0_g1_i1.p1  ORF type:complete len:503 (+),score=112.89 TRINITY_DN16572_c0_g1_i1:135-1643(+)
MPDSPAYKAKLRQKKKQQERRVIRHSDPTCHDSALRRTASVSLCGSMVSKAKRSGQKPSDDGQQSSGDEVFAAFVARQAQVRKEVAVRRRRRCDAPARSTSKGGQLPRSDDSQADVEVKYKSHQECAAEIIAEMANAMKPKHASGKHLFVAGQDLVDRNWSGLVQQAKAAAAYQTAIDSFSDDTSLPSRRPKGSRPWSSPQRYSNFAAELPLSPWEILVQQHRQRAGEEKEEAAHEQEESVPEAEHSGDLLESDDDMPSAPAWERPSSKQMPVPPPLPPHRLQFYEFQKELAAMEKERELQRELQREHADAERQHRSHKHEWKSKQKEEGAAKEQQKIPKNRVQQSPDVRRRNNTAATADANVSDTHCEPSQWAWSPWRCLFFPRRHSGETTVPGRSDSCGRGQAQSRAKVAPECDPNLGADESTSKHACFEMPLQEPPRNKFILEIDELMDRTRGLSLQERRKTFRELQRHIHPDKNLAEQDAAKLAFQYLMDNRNSFLKA